MNIIILGAPGSGKGTQSELIIKNHGLRHISTGDILRNEIAKNSELGKTVADYMSRGLLIPDEVIINVLDNLLEEQMPEKGIIFDGFPRTIPQAEALKKMLNKRKQEVSAVIGLEVPEDELTARLIKRGEISGRSDDNEETIKKRIRVYHENTEPLTAYYKKAAIYCPITGKRSVEEIAEQINEAITNMKNRPGDNS